MFDKKVDFLFHVLSKYDRGEVFTTKGFSLTCEAENFENATGYSTRALSTYLTSLYKQDIIERVTKYNGKKKFYSWKRKKISNDRPFVLPDEKLEKKPVIEGMTYETLGKLVFYRMVFLTEKETEYKDLKKRYDKLNDDFFDLVEEKRKLEVILTEEREKRLNGNKILDFSQVGID